MVGNVLPPSARPVSSKEIRLRDDELLLMKSIKANRVGGDAVVESRVEYACACANRVHDALVRPRYSQSGREIIFVLKVRLEFVTQSERKRHLRRYFPVVLYERADLPLRKAYERVAAID